MNEPPEANTQYSRGSGAIRRPPAGRRWAGSEPASGASAPASDPGPGAGAAAARGSDLRSVGAVGPAAVLAAGAIGALLLVVSQFTSLYDVHVASSPTPVKSIGAGSNHAYAMIPIALAAAALLYGVGRDASRPAALALAALGIIALAIALIGDLPDAHASGLVDAGATLGASGTHFVEASSTPGAGLYMETLGAVLLLVSGGLGFLLRAPGRAS